MDPTQPNELVLLLVKIGYLTLLWAFVLLAVRAVRADLLAPVRRSRRQAPSPAPAAQLPPAPARQPAGSRAAQPRPEPRVAASPVDPNAYPPTQLVVTAGPLAGTAIRLTGEPITIGRLPESTLVLDDDFVSARHARLVPHDGWWFVEDQRSTNGTFLEDKKVTTPMAVPPGAKVRIGKTVLELRR